MLQRRLVTTALIGARTPEQLDGQPAGRRRPAVREAQLAALDQVSQQDLPYPYSFIDRYTRKD